MVAGKLLDVDYRYQTQSFGTAPRTTLATATWDLGSFVLEELRIIWAPGHVALTGIRIMLQGTPLLPWNQSSGFLFGNAIERVYEMGVQLNHALTIQTQNNDIYTHYHILEAKLRDIPITADSVPPPPVQIPLVTFGG